MRAHSAPLPDDPDAAVTLLRYCLLALATAVARAQVAPPAPTTKSPGTGAATAATDQGGPGRTSLDQHSERSSRELFAACDGDSDDRLDLFEACQAIESLGDPTDSTSFGVLDTDRDGYLGWTEFDAHFRRVVERGNTFRVRTCRRFVEQSPELQTAKSATPVELFLQLHDSNQNGGLDPDEISKISREIGLLPMFESQLRMLDLDQSGRIESTELAPWFDRIRTLIEPKGQTLTAASALPRPWGAIDADGDGGIDLLELQGALRRLDPGLARWAAFLLRRLDRDKDGHLGADELPMPAAPVDAGATAARPAGLLGELNRH